MKLITVAGALSLVLTSCSMEPVYAQEPVCHSVESATTMMEENGREVLGVKPYMDGAAVYYRYGGLVFAAPIVDGCVDPFGRVVPNFVGPAESSA